MVCYTSSKLEIFPNPGAVTSVALYNDRLLVVIVGSIYGNQILVYPFELVVAFQVGTKVSIKVGGWWMGREENKTIIIDCLEYARSSKVYSHN